MKHFILAAASLVLWASCSTDEDTTLEKAPAKVVDAPHDFHPEWTKNTNIYEVNVRQYTPEGTFAAFQTHLPRLREMGVEVLWFMPVQPIGVKNRKGVLGSYYSIQDYRGVNPEFGTAEDLHSLIDEAHEMGFKIMLDWVPNHTAWDHPWMTESPDFYYIDPETNQISNGRDDHNNATDWTDVAELDYSNPAMMEAQRQDMLYWIDEYQVDGFRVDMAGGQTQDYWTETIDHLRAHNPELLMLAESEYFYLHESRFDMTYGWEFHHLLNNVAGKGTDVATIDDYLARQAKDFPADGYRLYFIDNHDENSWNGTVEKRIGNNAHAAFVLCATMSQGMPLIYSGQEVGLNKSLRFFERDTIDWSAPSQADFYSKALALKKTQGALANGSWGGAQTRITTNNASVYAFSRVKGDNIVTVFVNFSAEEVTIDYSGAIDEDYTNWFTGEEAELEEAGQITLPANGYLVLTHGEC
jgi:glycosidase